MTLVLTPDTLGEVQVQVTLNKGAIELALRGAHEQGRAALLEALPELRRDLEAAGLNPSRLEVARETGSSLLDRQPHASSRASANAAASTTVARPVTTLGSPCRYRRERAVPADPTLHVVRRGRPRLRRS